MCCFSAGVEGVDSTRIFARRSGPNRQVLVYQMKLRASQPVAMILPVPGSDLRFISLQDYPDFFEQVKDAFPRPAALNGLLSDDLAVEEVGDFIASFVPTMADFSRVDPRFRLPETTLRGYEDYAFAVFQLKAMKAEAHPMAFEFTTRSQELFFPTVHVHDGKRHPKAKFAHDLYAQGVQWDWRSYVPMGQRVKAPEGLIDPAGFVFHRGLYGELPNEDYWA